MSNIKETFKSVIYSNILCTNNNCMKGCVKPKDVSQDCETSIFKENDGKCYTKCPYKCNSPLDKCVYDNCCEGCGKIKMEVPCIGFDRKPINIEDHIGYDGLYNKCSNKNENKNENNTLLNYTKNKKTIGNNDYCSIFSQNKKLKQIDEMMSDITNVYNKQLPCSLNITGTFTECGLTAYNT